MEKGPGENRPTCAALEPPVSEADHVMGLRSAPVVLVEYGDFECPYCLNAVPVVNALRAHFGEKLAVVFRHFPQNSVHPHASAAAQAAEAAAAQGKFWQMHELLYKHQKELADLDLTHLALQIGLEVYKFQADLERSAFAHRIREDFAGGLRSGVNGTPTFFINGCRHDGQNDLPSLRAVIEAALDASSAGA